jgi:hypothetical protein
LFFSLFLSPKTTCRFIVVSPFSQSED